MAQRKRPTPRDEVIDGERVSMTNDPQDAGPERCPHGKRFPVEGCPDCYDEAVRNTTPPEQDGERVRDWTVDMLREILEASQRGFEEGKAITLGDGHERALWQAGVLGELHPLDALDAYFKGHIELRRPEGEELVRRLRSEVQETVSVPTKGVLRAVVDAHERGEYPTGWTIVDALHHDLNKRRRRLRRSEVQGERGEPVA